MFLSLTGIAVVGVLAVGGRQILRQHRRSRQTLVAKLRKIKETERANEESKLANLTRRVSRNVVTSLTSLDDRYQQVFQRRIDALLSGRRHAQWQEIAGGEEILMISPEDKMYNRRIARLGGVVVTATLAKLYTPFLLLTIPLAFYELIGKMLWTVKEIKRTKRLEMKNFFVILLAGMWATGYFVIGSLSFLVFNLIEKLTLQSQDRTRKELVNILGKQPRLVWVLVNGVEMEIPFERLQVGDRLVIQAGQMIPVDGVIMQGHTTIDQHRLTGESQPAEKGVGDPVLAATVVLSGRIHIQVEKTGEATLAAQIGDILANTLDYHLSIEERSQEMANHWVIPSLLMTGLAGITLGLKSAVAMLSNMPGIDMIFLGPITLLNYLNLASRYHILIKDGRSLELLHKVDTVLFDKTGTLTLEQPQVKTVHLCANLDTMLNEDTILTVAAAAEQRQEHPIAKAILIAASERGLTLPPISDAHYELGYGLRVWLEQSTVINHHSPTATLVPEVGTQNSGLLIRVGSQRFMMMEGIAVPPKIVAVQADCHELGHSLVMVAIEDRVVGAIELQPTIRAEARAVIEALHERHLTTAIISGDQEAPTRTLARELGIERYFANVLPEEKAAFVSQLQAEGKTVCFVGDGINDAIALKKAEVSISLRGATTIATDTAQIVLMDQSLRTLPTLFDLSHELERNLMTSLVLVTVPCFFVIGGIFFFHVGIPLAVTAYTGTFAVGVANAMSPIFRHRLSDEQEE